MRKALLMVGALLALSSATAFAQGIDLNWNTCSTNGRTANIASLCTSNAGGSSMVATWYPPANATQVTAVEIYLDYATDSATLPCWWNFATGALPPAGRGSGAVVSDTDPLDTFLCPGNYIRDNKGSTGGGWIQTGPNKAAFRFAIAAAQAADPDDVEQFGMSVRIQNTGAAGTTNCPGCLNPSCFVLNRITITQLGAPNIDMTNPVNGNFVSWRSAQFSAGFGCPAATPTHKATWGSIKALYR